MITWVLFLRMNVVVLTSILSSNKFDVGAPYALAGTSGQQFDGYPASSMCPMLLHGRWIKRGKCARLPPAMKRQRTLPRQTSLSAPADGPASTRRRCLLPLASKESGPVASSDGPRRMSTLRAGEWTKRLVKDLSAVKENPQVNLETAMSGSKEWPSEDEEETESDGNTAVSKEKARRTRELRRCRQYLFRHHLAASQGTSILELESVTPRVRRDYEVRVEKFLVYCEKEGFAVNTDPEVDEALVRYMSMCFLRGQQKSDGEHLLAGLMALVPRFGRGGDRSIPRAIRAMKGWRRLAPGRSRRAYPWPVWAGVSALLIQLKEPSMAAWIILAFWCYLRPSETMGMTGLSLVRPAAGVSRNWSIFLFPEEGAARSKINEYDDTLAWDISRMQWMTSVFEVMKETRGSGPLWPFTYPQLLENLKVVKKTLNLPELMPYQLRHSGPSWDRARGLRQQSEVQKRGRWRSLKSVVRYEKHGRLSSEMHRFPAETQSFLLACAEHLEGYLVLGREVPPAPRR